MRNTLIIGASRGIGRALALQHHARGERVTALNRRSPSDLARPGLICIDGIDVAQPASLEGLATRLGNARIDRLIISAGVLSEETYRGLDEAAFERMRRQFEVNTLGPLRLVRALDALLGEGSQIGILTSRMGSIADNGSGGYYGYRASKTAVNAVARSLSHDLRARGIAVSVLHPGFVRTDMTSGQGDIDPDTSARGLIQRLDELTLQHSGGFRHANGSELPW